MDNEYMITSSIRKPLPKENHFLSHQENLNKIKQVCKTNFKNSIIILVHTFLYIYIFFQVKNYYKIARMSQKSEKTFKIFFFLLTQQLEPFLPRSLNTLCMRMCHFGCEKMLNLDGTIIFSFLFKF